MAITKNPPLSFWTQKPKKPSETISLPPNQSWGDAAGWNTQLKALHQQAVNAAPKPTIPASRPTLPGEQSMAVRPPSPATTSPKPAMATPAPKPSVAPSAAPYGGVPEANDPAMVGGRAMLDQRKNLAGVSGVPEGWDAETYANFKKANPTLEPDQEDTFRMQQAGNDAIKKSQLEALRQSYLGTFSPSAEEAAARQQLGDVSSKVAADEAAARSAYAKRVGAINEQATLQPFLTGRQRMASGELADQLAALESSSKAQTVPLSTKLAQLQAEREAKKARAKAEVEFATPATKDYQTVGEGQSLVDPATGRVVYQGPAKTSTAQPTASIQEYQFAVQNGYKGSFSDYQTEDANRKAVAAGAGQPSSYKEWELAGRPGTYQDWVMKTGGAAKPLSGEAAKVYSIATTIKPEIEQIKTLLKGAGRLKISQILSGLDPAASRLIDQVADKVGRLRSGGAINKDEAERFKAQILRAGDILTGDTTSAIDALDALAAEADSVASSVRPGATTSTGTAGTPEEAGFEIGPDGKYYPKANSGKPTASTTGNAKAIAAAIKKVESGGNYNARGGSGEFGAYQFMPDTWRGWAKTYLGNSNAPMTPQNQDVVAEAHISSLLAQGKTPEQIALIWNGGQPVRKAGVNKFGVRYDSGAYADKVLRAMNA